MLTYMALIDFDGGDLLYAVLLHGRRAGAVHLVQQLRHDSVEATPTPSVVAGIAVKLKNIN